MKTLVIKANRVSIHKDHLSLGKHSVEIKNILFVGQDALVTRYVKYRNVVHQKYTGRIIIVCENISLTIKPASNIFGIITEQDFIDFNKLSTAIRSVTFINRIKKYSDSLKQRGFFNIGIFQLKSNGELFRHGRYICNILQNHQCLKYKNYEILVSVSGYENFIGRILFKKTHRISIYFDFDCFYALFQNVLGLTISNGGIHKLKQEAYYNYALRLATRVANADGKILKQELETLKKSLDINDHTCPDAAMIFNSELQNPTSISILAKHFVRVTLNQSKPKHSLLVALVDIALSDGELHPSEVNILKKIATFFNLSNSLDSLLAAYKTQTPHSNDTLRFSCLKVLGLEPTASEVEIKKRYRQLVKEFHPDILRGAGAGLAEIDRSDKFLQKINAAYNILIRQKS